jgi:hypothetical protein
MLLITSLLQDYHQPVLVSIVHNVFLIFRGEVAGGRTIASYLSVLIIQFDNTTVIMMTARNAASSRTSLTSAETSIKVNDTKRGSCHD